MALVRKWNSGLDEMRNVCKHIERKEIPGKNNGKRELQRERVCAMMPISVPFHMSVLSSLAALFPN